MLVAEDGMTKAAIVDTLNDLIRIVEDSHEGYRQAAEGATEGDLKAVFNDLAAQRGAIVRELQRGVAEIGGAPDMGGTMLGGAHRFLLDLRRAVVGLDRDAVLGELDRAEGECARQYEAALDKGPPAAVAAALTEQLARIRADRQRIGALRTAVA